MNAVGLTVGGESSQRTCIFDSKQPQKALNNLSNLKYVSYIYFLVDRSFDNAGTFFTMPVFIDCGTAVPVPSQVKVALKFCDKNGRGHLVFLDKYPTIPLITLSKVIRRQILHGNNNDRVILDCGWLHNGVEMYREILAWLVLAYKNTFPGQPVPMFRSYQASLDPKNVTLCLEYHTALLALELVFEAKQHWLRKILMEGVLATFPNPRFVMDAWSDLWNWDRRLVKRVIAVAARRWMLHELMDDERKIIQQLVNDTPKLWVLLVEEIEKTYPRGAARFLVEPEHKNLIVDEVEAMDTESDDNSYDDSDMREVDEDWEDVEEEYIPMPEVEEFLGLPLVDGMFDSDEEDESDDEEREGEGDEGICAPTPPPSPTKARSQI